MIRRPPRSTLDRSSAASDVYKRQVTSYDRSTLIKEAVGTLERALLEASITVSIMVMILSLIHISEPTRPY